MLSHRMVPLLVLLLAISAAAAAPAEPVLSKTAAYELLEALDLLKIAPREGLAVAPKAARPDGSYAVRITLDQKPAPAPLSARGLDILRVELANSKLVSLDRFDLLYNAGGRLIAVFPVFPDGTKDWPALKPTFFDLSPFYFEVPRSDDPAELECWTAFVPVYAKDQASIAAFRKERYRDVEAAYPDFVPFRYPYRLHEIDDATGRWNSHDFSPLIFGPADDDGPILGDLPPSIFLKTFKALRPGRRRTVIPAYPTVYVLNFITPAEREYLRLVSKKHDLPPDPSLLVVGPGTGVDAWIASLRTKRPVAVIGINPLEVANTKAAARIAGFEVRAIVGDNVADEEGRARFPGERFDAVFWNMPAVWPEGSLAPPSMAGFWDGDVGAATLKRFAQALPGLLKPDGRALLWNLASFVDGKDIVAGALETAATGKKVFDVEVLTFVKRQHSKEELFKERLYSLSRAR